MLELFDILKAIIVRCILVIHAIVAVWRVTESYHNDMYWLLACILVLLFAESCYTVIKRRGREYQRFMPAFFCYLCTILTCIWLLELDKSDKYIEGQAQSLDEQVNSSISSQIPAQLTPNTWIMLVEEMLPYFLFISRWLLPRGKVKREQLVELLFAFIGIGGDIMEYFSLLGEEAVRTNKTLCYVVLAIWSFSVLQFTMTVTVIHQPKRQRNINVVEETGDPSTEKKRQKFRHEVSAIFLTMIMQDLPFMIVRLYVMIGFNIVDYSIIFFTSKNIMIISLLFYKLAIICSSYFSPKKDGEEDDDDDEDDKDDEEGGTKKKRGEFPNHSQVYSDPKMPANHIYEKEMVPENNTDGARKKTNGKLTKKSRKSAASQQNPFPDGKLYITQNGLAVNPYLIENPSFQYPPVGDALRGKLVTRSTNTSPSLLRAAHNGFIKIEHTTPRGDESQDTGFSSDNLDKSPSNSGSQRSSAGSQFNFKADMSSAPVSQQNNDKHSSLDDKHSSLDDKHSSLDDKHSSLDDKLSSLDDKHSSLDGKHSSLDDKHSSLDDKLKMENTNTLKLKNLKDMENLLESHKDSKFTNGFIFYIFLQLGKNVSKTAEHVVTMAESNCHITSVKSKVSRINEQVKLYKRNIHNNWNNIVEFFDSEFKFPERKHTLPSLQPKHPPFISPVKTRIERDCQSCKYKRQTNSELLAVNRKLNFERRFEMRERIRIKKTYQVKRVNDLIKRKTSRISRYQLKTKQLEEVLSSLHKSLKKSHLKCQFLLKENTKLKKEIATGKMYAAALQTKIESHDYTVYSMEKKMESLTEEILELKKVLSTKENKKQFHSKIRLIIYSCIECNVPVNSISKVITACASLCPNVTIESLPNASTIAQMSREMGAIADLQLVDTLIVADCATLAFDATSLKGSHINQIHFGTKNNILTASIAELPGGKAEDYVQHILQTLDDLAETYSVFYSVNKDPVKRQICGKIVSTLTDRASANHAAISQLNVVLETELLELHCHLHPLDGIASEVRKELTKTNAVTSKTYGSDCKAANLLYSISKLR
ncbi:hypothetical protein Btru_025213 [Bulinus truncatus]|nr:hypothetical protein Btru_025213 [Bulinus truncatus]